MSKGWLALSVGLAVFVAALATALALHQRHQREKAALCRAQLEIVTRMPAHAGWEPSEKQGYGKWFLRVEQTRTSPYHMRLTFVEPDMVGLSVPVTLKSGEKPKLFHTQEVALGSGFSIKYQGSYAYLDARRAASLNAARYSLLFPIVGSTMIKQADGQVSGRITHTRDNGQYHAVDIGADLGTPVRAAKAGMVVFTENRYADLGCRDMLYASVDNVVTVLHDDGTEAIYGHLRQGSVRVGENERVEAEDIIAEVGNSGASDGPHLHFQVGGLTEGGYVTLPLSFKCEPGAHEFYPTLGPVTCSSQH